jgi:fatty acid desaturase
VDPGGTTPPEARGLALFTVVPPLAAFGAWFAGWHALRHTGRLVALIQEASPGVGRGPAVRRFAAHAALPTVATLAVVVVLSGPQASAPAVSTALAVLLALTFPHLRTVSALDRWAAASPR